MCWFLLIANLLLERNFFSKPCILTEIFNKPVDSPAAATE